MVEVPVEVETTIGAPLDLLTLKKDCTYDKYEFLVFLFTTAIPNNVFNDDGLSLFLSISF